MNEEEEDALSAGTPPPLVVGGFSLFEEDEQVAQRLQSLVPITRPQSRRMYLPLQLSWSEEQVMQQIGRAHRSNQGNQSATGTALRAFALDGTYSGDGTYASPIIII
ncbi:hypothetical protein T484DRAFT_1834917 [Baffinella frigidus]|nr:hypothetical protein T484DRAFT_1834917 [Cryptophyta sp. CCMP2293]